MYGAVPPFEVSVNDPLLPPKHNTFCDGVADADNAAEGCVMVTVLIEVHPRASVTVTVYVHDKRFTRSCDVAPLLQL